FRFRPIAAGATTGWALYPCWEPPDSQPCTCRTDNNPEDDCVREMRRERSWQQPPVQPCRPRACVLYFLAALREYKCDERRGVNYGRLSFWAFKTADSNL